MRTDRTSRDEVDAGFERVMPSPFWNQRARAQPERAGTDLEQIGESNFGVTCDSNDLSKMATRAFQQEVVSRIVTGAESQLGTTATRSASWHSSPFQDSVPHELRERRGWRSPPPGEKHRSSCSTVEKDFAAATVMDRSALPAIDALPGCDAISETPRAAGYRGSDFVLWHIATVRLASAARA